MIWRLQTGPVTADANSHVSFIWRLRWPLALLDHTLPLRCCPADLRASEMTGMKTHNDWAQSCGAI